MPTTREFKTRSKVSKPGAAAPAKKKSAKAKTAARTEESITVVKAASTSKPQPKRRPGRQEEKSTPMEVKMNAEMETPKVQDMGETPRENVKAEEIKAEDVAAEFEAPTDEDKVEINFAGSELLRSRFPKPFEVAEAVATDWMKDGKFDHLPISHPLANWAAQQGLTKAKEIEKKVVESPRFEKAAMTALTMAMKAQATFEQLRAKVKR